MGDPEFLKRGLGRSPQDLGACPAWVEQQPPRELSACSGTLIRHPNCSGPGSLNRFSASLSGVLPGLGCHADRQRVK